MNRRRPLLWFLCSVLLISGCDLFSGEDDDLVIEATGRVVHAGTGAPIAGLSAVIVLVPAPIGAPHVLDQVWTDAEGRFALTYRRSPPTGAVPLADYLIEVNARPYDDDYTLFRRPASLGRRYDFGTIELEER